MAFLSFALERGVSKGVESLIEAYEKYKDFKIYPCMPYGHKYANAVTELGILGTLKKYVPGNIISTLEKVGIAYAQRNIIDIMEILIDVEMKMFKDIHTPIIFIQNVVTDLILGLGMKNIFVEFSKYIKRKYRPRKSKS